MKSYIVYPQYQAPGGPSGGNPNNVITAKGLAIRIEPIPTLNGGVAFPPNRHLQLDGSAQVRVAMSGSSWFPSRFDSFQFEIETAGTAASDGWLVYVAEEQDDPATYGGVGLPWSATYQYNTTTGLYTGAQGAGGAVSVVQVADGGGSGVKQLVNTRGEALTVSQGAESNKTNGYSVTAGTPVQATGLTGGVGQLIGLTFSTPSVAGVLHISIGAANNPGYYLVANASGGASIQLTPPPDPNSISIFLEASTGTMNVEAVALYSG